MKKILLVDDSTEIRELVSATLGGEEYTILCAGNGSESIAMATEHVPDCIVMDIEMPGSHNGIEATREIKNKPATAHCPVVVLSGVKDMDRIDQCLEAGADDYLLKPFSPLELINKVESLLHTSEA